ncbi:MAG: hypothetical protein V1844_26410 [Pseudomonadota bacterium]
MTVLIRSAMPMDPLVLEGWERQNTLDEPRLSEVAEMYREIGFEVRIEPFDPDRESGCTECMKASTEKYKTIYTRRLKAED